MSYRTWILVALALNSAACSKKLKSATPETAVGAVATGGTTPVTVTPASSKITGPNGELTWATQTASAGQPVQYDFELKVPFGHVYRAASAVVRNLAPYSCQWVQGIEEESPSNYTNGEVPCGAFVDAQWKRLLTVPVDPYYASVEGFGVVVTGANIPVYLSRGSLSGNYSESDLTYRQQITKPSSTRFAEDISLRYTPAGATARLELCGNLPGAQMTAPPQYIYAKASRSVFGIRLGYDSTFTVTPGQATFDYGRGCVAARYGWTNPGAAPSLEIQTTEAPHLANANYQGLNIYINDWFLRLVDNILAFFRVSFRQKLIAQISREANNILDRDVESGAWFTKVHANEMIARMNDRINRQVGQVFNRVGFPSSPDEVKKILKDSCRIRKLSGANWTQRLEVLCRDLIDQIDVQIEPFAIDAESNGYGCYNYFANIHQSDQWWGRFCKFSAKFKVRIPSQWKDYAEEVKTLLAAHIGVNQIPADWTQALQQLNIDAYTMRLLTEELERRGFNQVVPADWANQIPAILASIRQGLAN